MKWWLEMISDHSPFFSLGQSHEMPTGLPNWPSKEPGIGNPQEHMTHDWSDYQTGRPSQASNRGKRQVFKTSSYMFSSLI